MSFANAKFILGGEHSVVSRGRALAFPLPGLTLKVSINDSAPGLALVNGVARSAEDFIKLQNLCTLLGAAERPNSLKIESMIPLGAGLGSSAALCVALSRLLHPNIGPTDLATLALEGEKLFHLRASGVDPFAISLNVPVCFEAASLKVRPLNCDNFRSAGLFFKLIDTKLRRSTAEIQEQVALLRERDPLIWEDLCDSLASNVEAMMTALERGPARILSRELGRLMNDSHFRLIQLGVSTDAINEQAARIQRMPGCAGVKLTGAGRGGFLLALFSANEFDPSANGPLLEFAQEPFAWPGE